MLLYSNLPLPQPPTSTVDCSGLDAPTCYYKWEYGDNVQQYAASSQVWRDYTEREGFVQAFQDIVKNTTVTNDARATQVEQFLLRHAELAGVIKKVEITVPRNPNKWGKRLAPWFRNPTYVGACSLLASAKAVSL